MQTRWLRGRDSSGGDGRRAGSGRAERRPIAGRRPVALRARVAPIGLVALLGSLLPLDEAAAQVVLYPDEVERLDVISIEEDGRDLIAINAVGSGRPRARLEVGEFVAFLECSGRICVALTDRRALGIAVGGIFQEARFRIAERVPERALVSQRLALVATQQRVLGFVAEHGRWVEEGISPGESVEALRVGAAVATVATNRRALGLAPNAGRFASLEFRLKEKLESIGADDTLATLRTDQRSLVFSGPTGTWTVRERDGG